MLVNGKNASMMTPKEYSQQVEREEANLARWLLFGILAIIISFFIWAFLAEMETLTRASGKVVPSSKVKVIQHFEGGIVSKILTTEGELVTTGQTLVVIDNTKAESERDSVESRLNYTLGKIARFDALIKLSGEDGNIGKAEPVFPKEVSKDIVFQETVAFDSAKAEFEANISEFEKKLDQRMQRKSSIYQEIDLRQQQVKLLEGTIQTYMNLKGARAVSRLEVDEKQNSLIETKLTIAGLSSQIPIIDSEIKEIQAQRKKYIEAFRYDAVQKSSEAKTDAEGATAVLRDRQGALTRTEITSPIDGVVNQLFVSAAGEVIRPGGEIAEIVPVEDQLVAEVLVPPTEIGFLEIGQLARIKVSAFDSSRYGSLNGRITNISSDTIANKEQKNQEFYRVRAATDEVLRDKDDKILAVTAGMTVTVDIVTGKKTVAEYILLPFTRGLSGSLRQR